MTDEIVMYLVFRADLAMPKGKLVAQGGHAVQLVLRLLEAQPYERDSQWLVDWEVGSYTKIALKVADEAELKRIAGSLDAAMIRYATIVDEGRTSVEPGTMTCIGLQPMPRSVAAPYVKDLKLL